MGPNMQRHSVAGIESLIAPEFFDQLVHDAKSDGVSKILAGAIIAMENRVLIVKRAPTEDFMRDVFEIPSGHVENGEDLLSGLSREVLEETSLAVRRISAYAGTFDYRTNSGKLARQFNFVVDDYSGQISLNPSEHSEYRLITPNEADLRGLRMSAETKRIIRDYGVALEAKK